MLKLYLLSRRSAFKNELNGGGRGIRTPARFDPPVGFQDRSLQPDLGIPPKNQWRSGRDSNPRPPA